MSQMLQRSLAPAHVRGTPTAVGFASSAGDGDARLAFLDGLLEHQGSATFVRGRDGRFVLASPALARKLGREVDEVVGRLATDLIPAELADELIADDQAVLASGEPLVSLGSYVRPDRTEHRFAVYRFPIRDGLGVTAAVGGYVIDLADVTTDPALTAESASRFRAVFDHAPIGQIYSGMDGVVTSLNAPMAAIVGYRPEDVVGRPAREFVVDEDQPAVIADIAALLAGQADSVTATRRFRHRDGHAVPVSITSALIRSSEGEPQWWVSMVRDITAEEEGRLELEQAHGEALRAADRLRVLHAISTAANEATRLDEIVPVVLDAVTAHLGRQSAALLRWTSDDVEDPSPVWHVGSWDPDAPLPVRPADLRAGVVVVPGADGHVILVALSGGRDAAVALAFGTDDAPHDEQLEMLGLVGADVSRVLERETAAALLGESERRFRSVFDSSPLPMGLSVGDSGTFSEVNAAFCAMLGMTREQMLGRSAASLAHPDDAALTEAAGAAALAAPDRRHRFELRFVHAQGHVVYVVVSLTWMDGPDGRRQLLGQLEDVTSRRTAEAMLRRQAEQDGLTGLANRVRLARALAEHGADGRACTLLFVDVDGFKLINDTRGHDVGDEVLSAVATRLRDTIRPPDLVARFGGDEFVVVAPGVTGMAAAEELADGIRTALGPPIPTGGGAASISVSIGIAQGRIDPCAPHRLLEQADSAMYKAKRLGKDRHAFYDDNLHRQAIERRRTEATLHNALDDGRFVIHYQPIVELADGAVVGFEALVRLVNEDGELVLPGEFIGVAEQSGLVVPMGTWVLRESSRWLAGVRAATGRPLTMSVNLAARHAARPDLAPTVLSALDDAGLPDDALTLELTESALLEADDATLAQLGTLRRRGVTIALDDFGTGYSSLTYLRRLPVSQLKVDRSFVAGMTRSASDRAIVRAVTGLAEDLGMGWVAEGVETAHQRDALRDLGGGAGGGLAQGFLFGRPAPGDDVVRELTKG